MSVWMVRARTPSFIIPITTLRIGNGNGDVKGLRLPLLSNKSWQFQLQLQQRNKEKKKRQNVTISYTNSSSGGDSASAALELEISQLVIHIPWRHGLSQTLVRGLVLLNCAGGMNNKAIVDDWRIKLLFPLLWFIDFLLKQRPIASAIFERVKQRETLRNILLSIYANKESVDETLVEIIREPANEEGALDAFVSIVTGPPGPNPVQLMPSISIPVLVLWGDEDPFTPLDGPVGKYFSSLPSKLSNVKLIVLEGVGHCPHDDRPELVHEKLLPWLAETFNF
ncbi:AB hydrolase-1 domain-containing protein [Citrus sinensis]|uniref:AB hydrolase-1 domain-containing protein n=1 Tax=Citrus sinensis TaxID=2711 RepID=A0ACB8M9E6_CITSI|nr:AB hydrolase-1 domain-containing protein [Citrus sinensis]